MQDRTQKEDAIAKAAYALLEARGYSGTSMLAIARKARASNETLYNWYGDKRGLFAALVARNAKTAKTLLEKDLTENAAPLMALERLGPTLLALLLGPRAIALNRAAAADPTGTLGAELAKAGRESVLPLINRLLQKAHESGALTLNDPANAADLYISLLVGDLQIRRVTGALPAPDAAFIKARAETALTHFRTLTKPD